MKTGSKGFILIFLIILISSSLLYFSIIAGSIVFILGVSLFFLNKYMIYLTSHYYLRLYGSEKRNFDSIIFGSTHVWRKLKEKKLDKDKVISFAFYRRNLTADFLILKHSFSYLREGGKVVITIDCKRLKTISSKKLFFPDIMLFHRLVLERMNIDRDEFTFKSRRLPIIYYAKYSLSLILNNLIKIEQHGCEESNNIELQYIQLKLLEMIKFCNKRDLIPVVVFINHEQNSLFIQRTKKNIKEHVEQVSLCLFLDDEIQEI